MLKKPQTDSSRVASRGRSSIYPEGVDWADPDVLIAADVKAHELHFEEVPETKVSFQGFPRCDSSSRAERKNLPHRVEHDVEYRGVMLKLRIAGRIAKEMFSEQTR